jgi:hypothetical protein
MPQVMMYHGPQNTVRTMLWEKTHTHAHKRGEGGGHMTSPYTRMFLTLPNLEMDILI